MHICFVALDYPSRNSGGGVGSQVHTLAHTLVQAGHRVTVVALAEPGLPAYCEDKGVSVYRVPKGNLHWYVSKMPRLGKHLALPIRELEYGWGVYSLVRRLLRNESIDVIEGTETGGFWLAACLPWIPIVVRLHGEVYTFHKYTPGLSLSPAVRLSRILQRFALRRARLLISPSYAHAQEIEVELESACASIEVIPNTVVLPVENEIFSSSDADLLPLNEPYILYVGRLERRKGVPTLLEAASLVLRDIPSIHFVLAGGNHPTLSQEEIEQQIGELALQAHVHFLGHVPREQLALWYRRATIAVLPSHYETFGLAALEPMAYGIPVVTTLAGALPEVVEDGISGILVSPGNAQALTEALIRLLRDPQLRNRLGHAGRERVRAHFDIEQHLDKNVHLYYRCIDKETQILDNLEHIFFSPHCDDVVLSCGGLISSLISNGNSVKVVTVFGGQTGYSTFSAYARHLHMKWGTRENAHNQRLQEDRVALDDLGIRHVEHWGLSEAPYRLDSDGHPLYASYSELKGELLSEDQQLREYLFSRVVSRLNNAIAQAVLYFPLSLGHHVDHQILSQIGICLQALGYNVQFYEEWPYVESYTYSLSTRGWTSRRYDIPLERKVQAASKYTSQVRGLGGSQQALTNRLRQSAHRVGCGHPQERYWMMSQQTAAQIAETNGRVDLPLASTERQGSIQDFRKFLRTLRWHELAEFLPVGEGYCLDIGCGDGRHRSVVQRHGYQWIGLDKAPRASGLPALQGDVQHLPYQSEQVAAVLAWQVMEYVEWPANVIAEAARVLEPGGVFCGSVSFLEPIHGRTLYNISPLLLLELLRMNGFTDIQVEPGLCSFALLLWTFLRRWGRPSWGRLAMPATMVWLVPLMAVRFILSWLWWRLGPGAGHGMRWVAEVAPLEFAGQVTFVARKPGRKPTCISGL